MKSLKEFESEQLTNTELHSVFGSAFYNTRHTNECNENLTDTLIDRDNDGRWDKIIFSNGDTWTQ